MAAQTQPEHKGDSGILSPLRHGTFRNMWFSNVVSSAGTLIQTVAAAWVMTGIATADFVALVQTATFLPMALFALPAGALADIYDRRKVQIVFFSLSLAAATLMAATSWLGLITPWVLLGLCFMVGTGAALSAPARGASISEQVPKEVLPQAVGLNNISYNLARSVGPAVGGAIVATFGATVAFAVNAVTFLPMIETLRRWKREPEVSRLPPEGFGRSIAAGLRYIAHMQSVRRAIIRVFIISFLGASLQSLMPLLARDVLNGDANTFGLLLGFFGAGAVCAIFVLQPLRTKLGNEKTMQLSCLIASVSLAALAFSRSLVLDFGLLLVAGVAWMVITTTISVMVQLSVPRWVMGRAIATSTASITLGISLGAWFWGVIARDYGVVLAFEVAAIALLLSLLLGFILPLADRDSSTELDERVLDDPDVQLGITGRSGPITVELQYRIAADKARDFYNLMREVQRIRMRNGAYDCSLSRDIAHPEHWVERFTCPTWDDYLRMRNRRTLEESALQRRAYDMHVGLEPIKVRRWLERPLGSVRWQEEAPDRGDEALRIEG